MEHTQLLEVVRTYYEDRLQAHGPTHRGVDWNSTDSQQLRFEQLLRVVPAGQENAVLGDYGCGYAALLDHLKERTWSGGYCGYDISPAMIAAARQRHPDVPPERFAAREDVLTGCDYVVASGLFNVKRDTPAVEWERYMLATIDRLAVHGRRGFAFNVLTIYSDHDRMRADLYYADPCRLFDLCKRNYSRHVALLHDYGLYEFTLLVRY